VFIVRDTRGRVLFRLEKDDAVPRDESGKIVGQRAGKDTQLKELALFAGMRMADLQLDLSPGDVVSPTTTRADFGIPGGWHEFVADEVSPVTYISHDRGSYFTENVTDGIKIVQAEMSLVGQQAEVHPGFTSTQFTTQGYALAARIPKATMANADFDLRKRTVRFLVDALRRAREARVATLLTTAGSYAAANQIAAVAGWKTGTNPAPLTDLFKALQASYLPADTLILPEIADQYFRYSPYAAAYSTGAQIRDFVQGGGSLPSIRIARAKQLSGGSPAYIWMPLGTGNVALVRTTVHDDAWKEWRKAHTKKKDDLGPEFDLQPVWEPNDAITDIGTSHTLRWLGEGAADGTRAGGVLVREFDDDTAIGGGIGTHWIVVAMNDLEIVPSNLVGALITGAVA
jgi:hypothetical protein